MDCNSNSTNDVRSLTKSISTFTFHLFPDPSRCPSPDQDPATLYCYTATKRQCFWHSPLYQCLHLEEGAPFFSSKCSKLCLLSFCVFLKRVTFLIHLPEWALFSNVCKGTSKILKMVLVPVTTPRFCCQRWLLYLFSASSHLIHEPVPAWFLAKPRSRAIQDAAATIRSAPCLEWEAIQLVISNMSFGVGPEFNLWPHFYWVTWTN